MIRGVTLGYKFKMRFAYAHFPIQVLVDSTGKSIEIKNFLGEKMVRKIVSLPGVTVLKNDEEEKSKYPKAVFLLSNRHPHLNRH